MNYRYLVSLMAGFFQQWKFTYTEVLNLTSQCSKTYIYKQFSSRKVRICNISPTEWIGKKDPCHFFGNDLVLLPLTRLQLTSTGSKIGLYSICSSKFLYGFHIFLSCKCKPSTVMSTTDPFAKTKPKKKVSHFLNVFFRFVSWFSCFKIWVSFLSFGIL